MTVNKTTLRDGVLLILAYGLASQLVMSLFGSNEVMRFTWLLLGPAVFLTMRHGFGMVVVCAACVVVGRLLQGAEVGEAIGNAVRHAVVLYSGAWAYRRTGGATLTFDGIPDYLRLFGVGVLMALTSGGGILIQIHLGLAPAWQGSLLHQVAGVVCGFVITMLPLLILRDRPNDIWKRGGVWEGGVIIGLSVVVGQVVFLNWGHDSLGQVARGYWMFLFVTLAALRLGLSGTMIVVSITALQALVGALHGLGFFSDDIAKTHLANYYFYMLSVSSDGALVAVLFMKGQSVQRALAIRSAELEQFNTDLRTSLARLNLVLKTTAEGIIGIDDESRITFANPAAATILGWPTVEEMIGKSIDEVAGHILSDGSSCHNGNCHIRSALDGSDSVRVMDESFTRVDGRVIPVEYVVSPLIVSDHVVGAIVAVHDTTERKAIEGELRRSNAELEQFAYVASHDLRQPLRMVTSYLCLIEKRLGSQLTGDIKDFFDFAAGGAKRMDRLILDLLEYSRTGRAGKTAAVALDAAVADARVNLTVAIRDADAEVIVEPGLPTVKGDPIELTRLFQNLIGNAVKYRAPDRRPKVAIACRRQGREWVISVADNGIGIPAKDHERAFAVFQRLVPQDKCEGTGIGLAICRKIVEHHGGRIWIESNQGEGATFTFTIPAM